MGGPHEYIQVEVVWRHPFGMTFGERSVPTNYIPNYTTNHVLT
jgi:hypothetical protein